MDGLIPHRTALRISVRLPPLYAPLEAVLARVATDAAVLVQVHLQPARRAGGVARCTWEHHDRLAVDAAAFLRALGRHASESSEQMFD
jgi:hypothetical protein